MSKGVHGATLRAHLEAYLAQPLPDEVWKALRQTLFSDWAREKKIPLLDQGVSTICVIVKRLITEHSSSRQDEYRKELESLVPIRARWRRQFSQDEEGHVTAESTRGKSKKRKNQHFTYLVSKRRKKSHIQHYKLRRFRNKNHQWKMIGSYVG